jgi:ATP-dependent Lon protease
MEFMAAPQTDDLANVASEEIAEIDALVQKVLDANLPEELKTRSLNMLNRLKRLAKYGYFSKEFEPVEKFIGWVIRIPWGKLSVDNLDLERVQKQLDSTHYGLQGVKERILEYVAMLNLLTKQEKGEPIEPINSVPVASGDPSKPVLPPEVLAQPPAPAVVAEKPEVKTNAINKAPVICFVGVQGIGKTSIAKSIAAALGRKFIRIPLGGLANVTELRGVVKSEVNSEPGQIIKSFIRSEVMNPLILLDEIDKVSKENSVQADVMAVLLEILDPEQNYSFVDHYLDYPVDLSKCIFICTANNLGGISAALLDRLEVIRMISYSDEEKIQIARNYLLPHVMDEAGLTKENIIFDDDVWPLVIRPMGFDAGIRQLERTLKMFVRKIAKKIVLKEGSSFRITKDNFKEYIPLDIGVFS